MERPLILILGAPITVEDGVCQGRELSRQRARHHERRRPASCGAGRPWRLTVHEPDAAKSL
jgi:hypothetical protein